MARQQTVRLDAQGFSPWLFVDNRALRNPFNVGVQVVLDDGAVLTYSVQATKQKNEITRVRSDFSATRALGVATGTLPNHGLNVGSTVVIYDSNYTSHNPVANFEGLKNVDSIVNANQFTYAVADAGPTSINEGRILTFNVHGLQPGITAQTANAHVEVTEPVSAFRLNITSFTSGAATLTLLQQG